MAAREMTGKGPSDGEDPHQPEAGRRARRGGTRSGARDAADDTDGPEVGERAEAIAWAGGAEVGDPDRADAVAQALSDRNEAYLRLAADFENYRRRHQQDLLDRSRYASEDAARALLPVLDNLRRALEHVPSDSPDGRLRDGLSLVVREFESALERLGVTPIAAIGAPFDPALHEAIGGDESDEVDTETVTHELQRGYRLHDRVLRPAMVRIAHPAGTG